MILASIYIYTHTQYICSKVSTSCTNCNWWSFSAFNWVTYFLSSVCIICVNHNYIFPRLNNYFLVVILFVLMWQVNYFQPLLFLLLLRSIFKTFFFVVMELALTVKVIMLYLQRKFYMLNPSCRLAIQLWILIFNLLLLPLIQIFPFLLDFQCRVCSSAKCSRKCKLTFENCTISRKVTGIAFYLMK